MAAACWFGGVWGDAEGESPEFRKQASDARCHDVVRRVYGHDDQARYEQLRALEGEVVADIAAKVETLAKEDPDDAPRSQVLAALVQAVAAAQREGMLARRAGERVRRDLDHEPDKLTDDEAAAVAPLRDTRMLQALLGFTGADFAHDAHALGILAALDRMEIARGLPRHMKIYAAGGANQILFGVQPPGVPDDVKKADPSAAFGSSILRTSRRPQAAVP